MEILFDEGRSDEAQMITSAIDKISAALVAGFAARAVPRMMRP